MGRLIQAWRRLSMHPLMRPMTERRILWQWRRAGRPIPPPPPVKHSVVKEYQSRFGPRVFIETGTFAGGMIDAVRSRFDHVVSIELDPGWHSRAVERFRADPRITLLQGDSGVRLQEVLDGLKRAGALLARRALFRADHGPRRARQSHRPRAGHHSRPKVRGHVVLIDDMRDFQGRDGYPTVDEVVEWIRGVDPASIVEVRDDILRWHPRE